jgi:hypothetical protein
MKAWKLDLWIALLALVVSGLTASAALYQSKVFSDQLSATVWPYLSFNATTDPSSFQLTLENDGAGPAIVTGAELFLDGKRTPSLARVLKQVVPEQLPKHGSFRYSSASIGPGQVIRAGASALVVKLVAPNLVARIGGVYPRVAINVYYCSLLNRCWVVKLHATERPSDVTGQNYPHTTIEPQ